MIDTQAHSDTTARPRGDHNAEVVLAPGYQAALFRAPVISRPRWRAVRRDGTRLPPVAELGVVIAQATAIAAREGTAWIVGADQHTIEITTGPAGPQVAPAERQPRWVGTVAATLERSRRSRRPGTPAWPTVGVT